MDITPQIRRAKADVEADLLAMDGVTGVGVGEKITNGERTGKACIRVYVDKKLPKSKLKKSELIPETMNGLETDVIERTFVLHSASVPLTDLRPMVDASTYDPLTGGIGIGPCRTIDGSVFVGTLGLVVEDNASGDAMMLSNFHVMCVNDGWSVGDTMTQPSRVDGGSCPGGIVGELTRAQLGGQVDGAVARIDGRAHNCNIHEIGAISGTATASDGESVRKRGRTTELTHGFVDDVALTVPIDYGGGLGVVTLTNQIGIAVDPSQSTMFGNNGDSGSVVVNDDNEVIGLYFAGTPDGTVGVANPIAAVFSALDVKLCVPSIVTTPWDDVTSATNDLTAPFADIQTDFRRDHIGKGFETIWETSAWADRGGYNTDNKGFDDVKSPAGYDTIMETIQEHATVQEGIQTIHEGGGWIDPGLVGPGLRDPRIPGLRGPGAPGGRPQAPFVMSTPHHASGAERFDAEQNNDLDAEIDQVRQYLRHLESMRNGS